MLYTFDYEETLARRVEISARNLSEALQELYNKIDEEEIVLDSSDFAGAKISMPLKCNHYLKLTEEGETVDDVSYHNLEIDWW